jgi:hypothetical protein
MATTGSGGVAACCAHARGAAAIIADKTASATMRKLFLRGIRIVLFMRTFTPGFGC